MAIVPYLTNRCIVIFRRVTMSDAAALASGRSLSPYGCTGGWHAEAPRQDDQLPPRRMVRGRDRDQFGALHTRRSQGPQDGWRARRLSWRSNSQERKAEGRCGGWTSPSHHDRDSWRTRLSGSDGRSYERRNRSEDGSATERRRVAGWRCVPVCEGRSRQHVYDRGSRRRGEVLSV